MRAFYVNSPVSCTPGAGIPMFRIVDRYLFREVGMTLAAVIGLVVLVTSGNLFARLLSRATDGRVAGDIILPLVFYGTLSSLVYLLPAALYMAIVLSFGRLYKDSEMAALRAGGIGYARLYRALLTLVVPYTVLAAFMAMNIGPWIARGGEELRARAESRSELAGIEAGRFVDLKGDQRVLFAETVSEDGKGLRNVFIYSERDGESSIVTAQSAFQEVDEASGRRFLVLEDGQRYEGVPGEGKARIADFDRHGVLVPATAAVSPNLRRDMLTFSELWASDDPRDVAELHWRLAVPLGVLVLTALALPISYAAPRQGRFGKVAVATFVYIIYVNLTTMGRTWLEKDVLPAWAGLWWVHLLMLILVVVLIVRQYGATWVWARLRGRMVLT